ncbi:hypothetical protein STRAU_6899 [Streptomyces aurantiacus JA 4570]|uniref:Uncharacterized protein n=1 Tax=Streptomyces aurantiacus JA 4570 TaxID=1286094 RepID=S3ZNV1_9ACTN|nr:hypothetical protein [Streptomyces aurantiacus]EPH40015.1 hypothetical protein STRAU_6899 [Streptomyces aurantiacus JA 4570]
MAITDDVRKTFTDPKPLYFVAGGADLAYQQAKKVPGLIEQLAAEAPSRIDAVVRTDPKEVQDKAAARAKEAREALQAKFGELVSLVDTDLKKLGESAQDLALRGVGVAIEYTVQAREKYDQVAEHGEQAADELVELADSVEPDGGATTEEGASASASSSDSGSGSGAQDKSATATAGKPAAAKKPAAKKTTAKKTTPPSAK